MIAIALLVVGYLSVGCLGACARAYVDPVLLELGAARHYSSDNHTSKFPGILFPYFLFWPVMLPFAGVWILANKSYKRGLEHTTQQRLRTELQKRLKDESDQEIQRIIKEHQL